MIIIREKGQPVSLVNAFEKPVQPSKDQTLTERAIDALTQHYTKLKKMYGLTGTASCVVLDDAGTALKELAGADVSVQQEVPSLIKSLGDAIKLNVA